jgi:hypothetical protein
VGKLRRKLGVMLLVVKNFIQKWSGGVSKLRFKIILWKKSGRIYTKNLLNYTRKFLSFTGFARTYITTIYFNKEYLNEGGMWR